MALTKVDISLMDNTTGFTIVTKVVTVAASKLVIDGVSQDTLTLTEGYTYKFDTSHATLSGHTVSFATAADAAGSTQYTTGVTTSGTPGNAGAYTQIVVAQSAPALYYYCANHASMGGTISTPAASIANKLLAYDGSGNLPAVDGSQLTNASTATSSASDPTVSTNPAGGVGTQWNNTTSGEVYICTDATAGANVWTNVGAGSGDIRPLHPDTGENNGYAMGGWPLSGPFGTIDKYSYSSDGNATKVADLQDREASGSQHSTLTHGYYGGGLINNSTITDTIQRFQFSNDSDAVDTTQNLLTAYAGWYYGSCQSDTYAYVHGGKAPYTSPANDSIDVIQKFQFNTSNNATDVGNLYATTSSNAGANSLTHGYAAGGYQVTGGSASRIRVIQKWPFASDTNATDVGDIQQGAYGCSGCTTTTHGYSLGGHDGSSFSNIIEKYSYAADGNATDVGNMTEANMPGTTSSQTHGYRHGGNTASSPNKSNVIDKFSFSAGGNATDVGDIPIGSGYWVGGAQY